MVYNAEGRPPSIHVKLACRHGATFRRKLTPFFLTDCKTMIFARWFRGCTTLLLAVVSMFSCCNFAGRRLAAMARADARRRLARDGPGRKVAGPRSCRSTGGRRSARATAGRRSPRARLCHRSHRRADPAIERVLCFDEQTGKPLWTHRIRLPVPRRLSGRSAGERRHRRRPGLCPRHDGQPALLRRRRRQRAVEARSRRGIQDPRCRSGASRPRRSSTGTC